MLDELYLPEGFEVEYRYADIADTDGRTLIGNVVRYGDVSTRTPYGAEQFLAGAFGDVDKIKTRLIYQHDRNRPLAATGAGLVLTDTPDALRISATLPETRDADDALENVAKGIFTGFSAGFIAGQERDIAGVRSIRRAALPHIGLVDDPAYDDSVITEIRQSGEGIEGEFRYDEDAIIAATGKVRKERVKAGAFDYAINAKDREINLVLGDNSRPLASKRAGSLILESTPTALRFKVKKLPRTSYVSDFLGMLRANTVTPGVIPFFSPTPLSIARRLFSNGRAVDEEPEEGNPGVFRRVIKSGLLTALSVMFRARRGNPGAVTRIPTRLRRPSTFQQNQVGAIRPISGDIVRDGRVIRNEVDIGPVAAAFRRRFI